MKRKANETLVKPPKRKKGLDPSDKLVRLLRHLNPSDVAPVMVELRHLGKRAIRTTILQGLRTLWSLYPEQVILSMHQHLLRRNTEAICVLLMGIDNYSRIVTILRVLAHQAQSVFIFTPLTRLPVTRFCHFVVGLKSAFKKNFTVKKFVDREFRDPNNDRLQAVLLNSRIAGKHASWVGRVVLKVLNEGTDATEVQTICDVVALSTLNLAIGFNDAIVCRSSQVKTQIFMDYAGNSLGRWVGEKQPSVVLSVVAQACMAFYATHKYLKRIHFDAHQGNITLIPWLESMGSVLAYAIDPELPGDCIPHHLVCVDTDVEIDQKDSETVAALQINNPTVRVRLVDWGMSCPFDHVRATQRLLRDNYDFDFIELFSEWCMERETPETDDWGPNAEFAGEFLFTYLGVYSLEPHAMSTYTRLDVRLIDYFALLVPLALEWFDKLERDKKAKPMFHWLRIFVGRLALQWLQSGIAVTDTYVLGALKDMFDKRLLVDMFDETATFWQRKFYYARSINDRDKDTYMVVLRRETDLLNEEIQTQIETIKAVALAN